MKIRIDYVSNSSSCSFIVPPGFKLNNFNITHKLDPVDDWFSKVLTKFKLEYPIEYNRYKKYITDERIVLVIGIEKDFNKAIDVLEEQLDLKMKQENDSSLS